MNVKDTTVSLDLIEEVTQSIHRNYDLVVNPVIDKDTFLLGVDTLLNTLKILTLSK